MGNQTYNYCNYIFLLLLLRHDGLDEYLPCQGHSMGKATLASNLIKYPFFRIKAELTMRVQSNYLNLLTKYDVYIFSTVNESWQF